jgi:superfamily II DNA or RNA helicase
MKISMEDGGHENFESVTMRQRADYVLCDEISDRRALDGEKGGVSRVGNFVEQLTTQLPTIPEEARPHQHRKITALYEGIRDTGMDAIVDGTGFGVVSPTGSGKTVMIAMVAKAFTDAGLRVVVLSPRRKIAKQIIGDDKRGFSAFAPEVGVGEYSGYIKQKTEPVTVMMYQALRGAVVSGDFEQLDPDVIICDEMHLAVQGYWGEMVRHLQKGRLSIGFTATPGNPDGLNTTYTFPRTVASTTLRQGIEEGMLSDLEVYTYQGAQPVRVRKVRGDFDPEELAARFFNAEENYLAAKIVAEEVAEGRSGLVKCTEGMDRMHAKIMHAILSQTEIPGQNRNLRVEYIDGEMDEEVLEQLYERKDRGEIDVLVSVNMFSLGYDGLREEFLVVIPPTLSYSGLEQLVGRVLRPAMGKVARVHQFVYQTYDMPQVLVQTIIGRSGIEQGVSVRSGAIRHYASKVRPYDGPLVQLGSFNPSDDEIRRKIAALNQVPVSEYSVRASQKFLPFDWRRPSVLAHMFDVEVERIEQLIATLPVEPRYERVGDEDVPYYSPQAALLIAHEIGVALYNPNEHVVFSEILDEARRTSHRHIGRSSLRRILESQGLESKIVVGSIGIVRAYNRSEVGDRFTVHTETDTRSIRTKAKNDGEKPARGVNEQPDYDTMVRSSFVKLSDLLVHPSDYAGGIHAYETRTQRLLSLVNHYKSRRRELVPPVILNLSAQIFAEKDGEVNPNIERVAAKQGLTVGELLFVATRL